MGKILKFGNDARSLVLDGINELEEAVTCTLGPKGRTVILDSGNGHPIVTKDGVSVAKFIDFTDKYKNIGASFVQEAARKTNAVAGDGTTTATLITSELCKAGHELVSQKFDAVDVKKGFEKAKDAVIEVLNTQKRIISEEDDILHIATISANNDEEIGHFICDAFTHIGEGGIVGAMDAHNRTGKTSITYSNGMEFLKGYFSSSVVNTDMETCYFENPRYLIYGNKVDDFKSIAQIIQMVNKNNEDLVIIAPYFEDTFQQNFITNVEKGYISAVAVVAPGNSRDDINENLGDIAALVGATIIEGKAKDSISIDKFEYKHLGSSESITVARGKTTITGGKGTKDEIDKRVADIKKLIDGSEADETFKTDYELDMLKERIAKLSGGIATIHIGAFSDIEAKEKKDRYEDAINAVNAAIRDGIIAGGGAGLLHAVKTVADSHTPLENPTQEVGFQKFLKIMEMPARRIIESTGKDPGYYAEKIKENDSLSYGFNAKLEEFSDDLYRDGVVDPVKVTEAALSYGTSVAGTFITSSCVITSDVYNCKVSANDPIMNEEIVYE